MTATYTKITVALNTQTDADLIEYLENVPNMAATIKAALRAQIQREATA